jgi:hypothetical protein
MVSGDFRHCVAANTHFLACPVGHSSRTVRLCCRGSIRLHVEAFMESCFAGNSAVVLRDDCMFSVAALLLPVLMARSISELTTDTVLVMYW